MARSIAIVGRHPLLEPGFNAAMSLNEALGFEAHGCKVTLYLPVSADHDPHALLARSGVASFDELPRYGGQFDVRPIRSARDVQGADVLVWQTYRASEQEMLPQFTGMSLLRTKNPPRVFARTPDRDRRRAKGITDHLDLVALSLRADLRVVREVAPELAGRFHHVPRGFNVDWLTGAQRGDTPVLGMDRAVKTEDAGERARRHIMATIRQLRGEYPDLHVLTLRERLDEIGSEQIPHLPLLDYYAAFMNRLWLYLPIDFEHSVHVKGLHTLPNGRRLFTGLYENQIVEAQVAGALVIVRRGDIPRELLMLPEESIVEDYEDIDSIAAKARAHIESFAERSARSQRLARKKHNHVEMARAWLAGMDAVR